ncbi:hypothetical protein [Roseivirga sp. E12]|uniref:hypothetical protein n=1 Tax=Roseivirga sp. E12 TaxID=2819237 RepID=UPI001ABC90E4|nr:hypothetical protein [Roseivirga sp. E12]MBO3700611.1 hypothetical protein [Roseivirga sp. E12]
MSVIKNILLILIIACGSFSCENESEISIESINESDLVGCWTHSYEEGDGAYRACDAQSFPVSRFRQVFEFSADFTSNYLVLASNDGHYMKEGRWSFNKDSREVKVLDLEGNTLLSFIITTTNTEFMIIEISSQNSFIGG